MGHVHFIPWRLQAYPSSTVFRRLVFLSKGFVGATCSILAAVLFAVVTLGDTRIIVSFLSSDSIVVVAATSRGAFLEMAVGTISSVPIFAAHKLVCASNATFFVSLNLTSGVVASSMVASVDITVAPNCIVVASAALKLAGTCIVIFDKLLV